MASIVFNDGTSATLTNGKPSPADRFSSWNPSSIIYGAEEEALGTGQLYTFSFRNDYLVTFELRAIPQSQMSVMLRLQRHLKSGGTVTVNTGDAASRSYATCCLQKGADCAPKLSDPQNIEYTQTFALRNVAGSPVDMICRYDA
jgi:hypothetical protein